MRNLIRKTMLEYLLALMAGFLVKVVDHIEDKSDKKKAKTKLRYPIALTYGIIIGVLISKAPFSTLFLAALLAQVFAGKIDCKCHIMGFSVAILSLLVIGAPSLEISILGFFFVLAMLDEMEWMGKLKFIADYRPFLKLGAFVFLFYGISEYLVGIMLFDIGYLVATKLYLEGIHLRF